MRARYSVDIPHGVGCRPLQRSLMSGIRSAVSTGTPRAAATSASSFIVAENSRPAESRQRWDADRAQYGCIFRQLRAYPSDPNRITKAAELIDQTRL